jgi:AmiR/NasT family two-component response regulator
MTSEHPASTAILVGRSSAERERLRQVLPAGAHVVGEAGHRWDAGELIRTLDPDVAVVDVSMLSTTEFFLCGWGDVPRTTRIVAVGPGDPELERRLRAAGAADYVVATGQAVGNY